MDTGSTYLHQARLLADPGFAEVADYLTATMPGSSWNVELAAVPHARYLVDPESGIRIFARPPTSLRDGRNTVFELVDQNGDRLTRNPKGRPGPGDITKISVNLARGPRTVARDILRRLIAPGAARLCALANASCDEDAAARARQAKLLSRLALAMTGSPDPIGHRRSSPVTGRWADSTVVADCRADTVRTLRFTNLSPDEAEQLLTLWRECRTP